MKSNSECTYHFTVQWKKPLFSHDTFQWDDIKVIVHNGTLSGLRQILFFPYTGFDFGMQSLKKPSDFFFFLSWIMHLDTGNFFFS